MSDSPNANGDAPRPLCGAIRTKGLFVFTETAPPPPETDTAVWWCLKTMTSIGPDDDCVNASCCDATRACFVPSSSLSRVQA